MSDKHTKTPWRVFNKNGVVSIMEQDTNQEIVHWTGFDASSFSDQVQANAEFIVRACNSHDDLVAALEAALDELAHLAACYPPDTSKWDTPEQHPTNRALIAARAALAIAKAKGDPS